MMLDSEQKQAPKQSPFFYDYLLRSQTIKAEKMVRLAKNSAMTPSPQKKQKLERAYVDDVHPRKNAAALVKEVIVIEEPAWTIPCFILFSIESLGFV